MKDVDEDIWAFDSRGLDLWTAINALRLIVENDYMPENNWRLLEVAALIEEKAK